MFLACRRMSGCIEGQLDGWTDGRATVNSDGRGAQVGMTLVVEGKTYC